MEEISIWIILSPQWVVKWEDKTKHWRYEVIFCEILKWLFYKVGGSGSSLKPKYCFKRHFITVSDYSPLTAFILTPWAGERKLSEPVGGVLSAGWYIVIIINTTKLRGSFSPTSACSASSFCISKLSNSI